MNPNEPTEPTPPRPNPSPRNFPQRPQPGAERPKQSERPKSQGGKPPVLDAVDIPTSEVRLRELDMSIEAEMEAALAGMDDLQSFMKTEDANSRSKGPRTPGKGPNRGKVISISNGDIFVEMAGNKSQGVIPLLQYAGDQAPIVGSEIEFDVDRYDTANGILILSRRGAVQQVDWSSVSVQQVVEARVTAVNKGGLSVEVNGIKGFLPISQIDMYRVEKPEEYMNQKLRCLVTEVEPEERNLVVSRRALLEREREEERAKFWESVEEGQVRTGIVRNIMPFGVFVDLGGADGMVPMSELAWARVEKPEDIVKLGQTVQVKVLRIDETTRKVSLSLRALAASPWDTIQDRIGPGSTITGKVTRVAEFGAFVEVEPGIEGLIHVSELGTQRIRRVNDVVKEGQELTVEVLGIDMETRRISLSLRAIMAASQRAQQAVLTAEQQAKEDAEAAAEAALPKPPPRVRPLRGGVSGPNPFGDKLS